MVSRSIGFFARKLFSLLVIFVMTCNQLILPASAAVDVTQGFYSYDTVDLTLGGTYPLYVWRHYQSANQDGTPIGNRPGPFGLGTHMGLYSLRAETVSLEGKTQVRLWMPTGGQQYFVNSVTPGLYANQNPSDPIRGTVEVAGEEITLTVESGTKLKFRAKADGTRTLESIANRFGKAITLSYSGSKLTQVTDPFGRYIAFKYENTTFPSQVTRAELFDDGGQSFGFVKYAYNSAGDLKTFTNAIDGKSVATVGGTRVAKGQTQYTYNNHYLQTIKEPRGIVKLTNTYGNYNTTGTAGKVTQQKLPGAKSTVTSDDIINRYVYNPDNTVVNDTRNQTAGEITVAFDPEKQNVTQVSHAFDGSSISMGYDSDSNLLNSFVNTFDQATSFSYVNDTPFYHLSAIELADGSTTDFSFTGPFGQLQQVTSAEQHSTTFTYNPEDDASKGSLQSVADPLPASTEFNAYNSHGQLLESTDGLGRKSTFIYHDEASGGYQDLQSVIDPSGVDRCFNYDKFSRIKEAYFCKFSGQKTLFAYDQLNRVISVTEPKQNNTSRVTKFTYDDNGNVTGVIASNGVTTTYAYNDQDQLASRTEGNRTESYQYNNLGLLEEYIDKKGQITGYTYDAKQRLEKVTFAKGFSSSTALTYSYNEQDKPISITDSSDASGAKDIQFVYETGSSQVGRLKQEITAQGTLDYEYDSVGNLLSVKRGGTALLRYEYANDDASLLAATLGGDASATELRIAFGYDPSGALATITYPGGLSGTFAYNSAGDIASQTFASSAGTLRQIDYSYDYEQSGVNGKGYLKNRTESGTVANARIPGIAVSQSFNYDEIGQLTCTQTNGSATSCPNTGAGVYLTSYDLDGNAVSISNSGTTRNLTYESAPPTNRLTASGSTTVDTDANGNILKDPDAAYVWNARDQLTQVTYGGKTTKFTYDALGRRISATTDGVKTQYVYSGDQLIEENTDGTKKRHLVALGLDSVLASRTGTADEYYLKDALNGSVAAAVAGGSSPSVKTGYGYSPFGTVSTASGSPASANAFQFAGAQKDASGLIYLRNRYYSPKLQRFISEDPIGFGGGDTNLYRYVGNTPHTDNDPTGLRQSGHAARGVSSVYGLRANTAAPQAAARRPAPVPAAAVARLSPAQRPPAAPSQLAQAATPPAAPAATPPAAPVTLHSRPAAPVPPQQAASASGKSPAARWRNASKQSGATENSVGTYSLTAGTTIPIPLFFECFGCSQPVDLRIDGGLPSGASGSFQPDPLNVSPVYSLYEFALIIATSTTTPPGTYTVTFSATSSEIGTVTSTLQLQVQPTPSQTITAGGSATYPFFYNCPPECPPASLSVSGLPSGAGGSFNPNPVSAGQNSTLTVTTPSNLAPGTYTLTINGSASGVTIYPLPVFLTVNAAPTVALSVAPTSATVNQGATASYTINLARSNFTGPVELSVNGLPSGALASIAPYPTTGNSSTLTITTDSSTAAGTWPLTINGTASGASVASASASLTVNPPPNVVLSATPASSTVFQGSTATYTVNLARTNFSGNVDLSVSGLPSGATATISPDNTTDSSATLTVTTSTGTAVGAKTLTISGTASGATVSATTVNLTVNQRYFGNLDGVTCSAISGWALDQSQITTPISVDIFADGLLQSTVLADGFRPDVGAIYGNDYHGFSLSTPASLFDGAAHSIDAFIAGTGIRLGSAPKTLTCAPPAVALSATPTTATVNQGATASYTVNLARTNYTGSVDLSVSGLPAGALSSLAPDPTTGTSAALTITTDTTTDTGASTLTIGGTASGAAVSPATVSLTVNAAPKVTLSATPTSATVLQGATATYTVNLTRTNFTGAVDLSVSGLPTGATATLSPDNTTAGSATLTVTTSTGTAVGTKTLTISGTASGATVSSTTVNLTVNQRYFGNLDGVTCSAISGWALDQSQITTPISVDIFADGVLNTTVLANGFRPDVGAIYGNDYHGFSLSTPASLFDGAAHSIDVFIAGTGIRLGNSPKTLTCAAPAVALSATPTTATVNQGTTATYTVNLTRSNFTGSVDLSVSGLPPGATATFSSDPTTANSVTLSVATSTATATGAKTLTIGGTASGATITPTTVSLTVNAAPTVVLSATPTSATVNQGAAASYFINLTRSNFTGSVDLNLSGLPSGATASFTADPTTGTAVTLNVATTTSTATGTKTLTLGGTASGATITPTTVNLTVNAAPKVTLSVSPATATVAQGGSVPLTVTLTRTNFTGAVDLNFKGLPSGATASFNPDNTTATSSTLTVSANPTAAPGSYTLSITGSASGATVTGTSASVSITATGAPPAAQLDLKLAAEQIDLTAGVPDWLGFVPVLGSALQALGDFQAGRTGWGIVNTLLAISDLFPAKALTTAAARAGLRGVGRAVVAGCTCFAAGTLVATEVGAKPIERVEPGEKVLAKNEHTGEQTLRRVKSTFQFDERPVYRLELRETDGAGERDALTVTGEHPFFLQDKGWTPAERLKSGDRVQAADGGWLRVTGLAAQEQARKTYNLEVEGDYSFFVGDTQAWVHNACPNPFGKLGDPVTQKTANSVISDLQARGFTRVRQEVPFAKGPFGTRNRFVDIIGTNPATGESLLIQIGKVTKRGVPVIRERRALDDIIFSPTIREFPSSRIIFVEKGKLGLP
ncbi:RHS repeat-associated core domain-containing protein [Gloeobacter morelensis]|uniref:Hint domain-containing protein n=1 Tax=Gloeobacter morelensis MG652769 TaxID=2781736 RepID=A0ABY3PKK0_9CYAN|nr:RHS repeat-associated core domain-containing protein [Gloeobacter morelensis]UFP94202.1 hypothetical protein ISF26_20970 [Gloeobacter morelensis MG652769]